MTITYPKLLGMCSIQKVINYFVSYLIDFIKHCAIFQCFFQLSRKFGNNYQKGWNRLFFQRKKLVRILSKFTLEPTRGSPFFSSFLCEKLFLST